MRGAQKAMSASSAGAQFLNTAGPQGPSVGMVSSCAHVTRNQAPGAFQAHGCLKLDIKSGEVGNCCQIFSPPSRPPCENPWNGPCHMLHVNELLKVTQPRNESRQLQGLAPRKHRPM